MDKAECGRLLEENLGKLYGWAFSRLYDKDEAEDLTGDIICAVLSSVHSLKNDDAFYGFMWRIAENVLGSRLRAKSKENSLFDRQSDYMGVCFVTPETDVAEREQINLLRRELALLSGLYRQTAVLFYFYGKSCKEISALLNLSSEMVRYYLFRSREILKEGVNMTREFGEKSYDPGTFRLDFWGGGSNGYWEIFERKLPGNILLAAYEKPLSVSELSGELGVAAPYLEDDLEILLKHGFIKETAGRYRTDIIIFSDEYEKEAAEKFKPICSAAADKVNEVINSAVEKVSKMNFHGNDIPENTLKFVLTNMAVFFGMLKANKNVIEKYGDYPPLSNGSQGFLFGYDNDYVNHRFNGIYGEMMNLEETAYVSVENYRAIADVQKLDITDWYGTIAALTGAVTNEKADENSSIQLRMAQEGFIKIKEGRLTANFAVFPEKLLENEIKPLLSAAMEETCKCADEICGIAERLLIPRTPKPLQNKCGQLAHIRYQMDVMAFIVESCLEKGYLKMPEGDFKPAMFGVIK
ncbi:MAG: sigma-70 family RNA polymerase sigma factor [Oscillospiraceae bacterium]|nr:sigma-70 family RNA polymerase sigma factor [Oscillospiraceae bacterium]